MFDRILERMRDNIRAHHYVMTLHAEEEMDNDRLSIFDVEHAVLTGEIVERQKDRATGEWKYLVNGLTTTGENVVLAAKISLTGKLVVITVFLA